MYILLVVISTSKVLLILMMMLMGTPRLLLLPMMTMMMVEMKRVNLEGSLSDPLVWLNCTTVLKKKLGDDRLAQINVCKLQNLFLF